MKKQSLCSSELQTLDIGKLFNIKTLEGKKINVPSQFNSNTSNNLIIDPIFVESIVNFLKYPNGDALYLFGPSGCGKTSNVINILDSLGWPCITMTLNNRFDVQDLIGHHMINEDKVVFVEGPLVKAMKTGSVLILNEIDLADPGELAGLNDILERRELVIIQNDSESVLPNEYFRVIVTANTKGDGDSANFVGTQTLNSAFLDRFRFLECAYPSFELENKIILKQVPLLSEEYRKIFIRVANEVRMSNLNYNPEHIFISVPMSTRALIRWCKIMVQMDGEFHKENMHFSLRQAFTARLSKDEMTYVHRILNDLVP